MRQSNTLTPLEKNIKNYVSGRSNILAVTL